MKSMKKFIISILVGLSNVSMAFAAPNVSVGQAAKQAEKGITDLILMVAKPTLVVVILVAGFLLLVKGQRGREEVKDSVLDRVVGVILIIAAPTLAIMMFGWFGV